MNIEEYRRAIYGKVCQHCIDLSERGGCTLPSELKCGIELYLPEIVQVVQSVKSPAIKEYVNRLREKVCFHCRNQNADGTCRLRDEANCGLDRYFELVVEAIEEVDAERTKNKKRRNSS